MATTLYNNTTTVKTIGKSSKPSADGYKFRLEVIDNGETLETNMSSVTVNVYAKGINGYGYYGSATSYLTVSLESSASESALTIIYTKVAKIYPAGTEVKIGTWTGNVEHEENGAMTIFISSIYEGGSSEYYYPKDNALSSGNLVLPNIARKTTANGFTGTVEKSTNISINPASSSFTHSLKLTFGSNVKYLTSNGGLSTSVQELSGSSFTFNVPSEYYTQFTSQSATGTLTLTTYSGDTSVGESSAGFTIYADGTLCLPYLTGTLKDTNSTTANLTAGSSTSNKIVKGYSTATSTLSNVRASSSNDSAGYITSLIINGESQSTSARTYSKANYSSSTMTVYVKNSRGCEKTFTLSATGGLVDYIPLTLSADFTRKTQTGSEVTLSYSGNYFNQSFGSVSNTLSLNWAYKEKGATSYTTGGTLTPTKSGNTYSGSVTCGSSFPYTKAYDFIIYYSDKLVSENFKDEVTKGVPLIAIFQDGYIQINGIDIKPVEVS